MKRLVQILLAIAAGCHEITATKSQANAEEDAQRSPSAACSWPGAPTESSLRHKQGILGFHVNHTASGLRWAVQDAPPGMSVAQIAELVGEMFDVWTAVHPGDFRQVEPNEADVAITFGELDGRSIDDDGDGICDRRCVLGSAGRTITLDAAEPWSFGGPLSTEAPFSERKVDFQSVVLHEIGHVIGLSHSDRPDASMFYRYERGTAKRALSEDDELAIRASAAIWQSVATPAPATDVQGEPLAITTNEPDPDQGGYTIYRFGREGWKRVPGGALRISADARGRLWVVRHGGELRVLRSDEGRWITIGGCAKDISVGAIGGAWIIGCDGAAHLGRMDPMLDDEALEADAAKGFDLVVDQRTDRAPFVSIAGISRSDAVVVDSSGSVYRTSSGVLRKLALDANHRMVDVGASRSDSIWAGDRLGRGIYALNIQGEIRYPDTLFPAAPIAVARRSQWQGYPDQGSARISVDSAGRPWVIDGGGNLQTTTK